MVKYLALFVAIAMSAMAMPVQATDDCAFCNATVRMDEVLASCFEQQLPQEVAKVAASNMEIVIVNLASCSDQSRTRGGGLPVGEKSTADELLDSSFVLARGWLDCFGSAVSSRIKPLQTAQLFVIADICG